MSQQHPPSTSSGGDNSLLIIIFFIGGIFGIRFLMGKYGDAFIPLWRIIRGTELFATFQFDSIVAMWGEPIRWGDGLFVAINESFFRIYRLLIGPILLVLAFLNARRFYNSFATESSFTMDEVMKTIWRRFPWLKEVSTLTGSNKLITPDILMLKAGQLHFKFKDLTFKTGQEPLEFLHDNDDNVDLCIYKLQSSAGPLLRYDKDGNVIWHDKYAKAVVDQVINIIPNRPPRPGQRKVREEAWERCLKTAHYERTFALHILNEAKRFMVYSPARFMWMRTLTGNPKAYNQYSDPFIMWRALLSHTRTPFVEASLILNQYHYEKAIQQHLKRHPEDEPYAALLLKGGIRSKETSAALKEILVKYEEFVA